ncbi:MAG: hypothetical protein PHQ96_03985 [Candidatus Omnitrophica bacterium]|nr:hypothetical protein [Candidatus Omnitrophota bacterium]
MRCPSKKDWVLFYYQEKDSLPREILQNHLLSCLACRNDYAALSGFLSRVERKNIQISEFELDKIIATATKPAARPYEWIRRLKEQIAENLARAKPLIYKPQFIMITIVIAILAAIAPFTIYKPVRLAQEDIAEVEVELALDDNSNLDILSELLGPEDFNENYSGLSIA